MEDCKLVKVPISMGEKLTTKHCPKKNKEIEDMEHVPYVSAISSMMYVMVCNRIDISHVVGVLSRYMLTYEKEHWTTINRVLRYLCGIKDYDIFYQGKPEAGSEVNVHVFVDVD
jgi:hypothetical protein